MRTMYAMIFFLLVGLIAACNVTISPNPTTDSATFATIPPSSLLSATAIPSTQLPIAIVDLPVVTPISTNQSVMDRAFEVIQALKCQDMVTLSNIVHPVNGVRFSPYAFVKDTDQVFSAEKITGIMADNSIYPWGNYSGTGEPINLSFPDYYAKFIYDVDFVNAPQMSLNRRLSTGNSLDNSAEFYPGSMFVEFYFPGFDPQYGGMDWRSLRLSFTEYNNAWYLVGIIHDEWTP
jgi:hypothetical protein